MEEHLISFETAKLAKEKGFNIDVMYGYGEDKELYQKYRNFYEWNFKDTKYGFISAPTQSLLQKWLREIHNIHIVIQDGFNTETLQMSYYPVLYPFIKNKNKDQGYEYLGDVWKNTYEEALEIGLQESLKLIK